MTYISVLNQPIDPGDKAVIERYYWVLLTLPRTTSGWRVFGIALWEVAKLLQHGRRPALMSEAREFIPLAVKWVDPPQS